MNESQLKQKRMRGKNFTEKELLIDLILPFKPIIENIKVGK